MSGIVQIGPCRIEIISRGLMRVHGGGDQPAIVAAIVASGGIRDGSKRCWWVEVRRLRALTTRLKRVSDPLFAVSGLSPGPESGPTEQTAVATSAHRCTAEVSVGPVHLRGEERPV
jgi:hypothetical protein